MTILYSCQLEYILRKKIAFVSGGGRGIGAAICKNLADAGYVTFIGYHSCQVRAELLAKKINSSGGSAFAIYVDIADRSSVCAAVSEIYLKAGLIDVLINNAAIAQEKPFLTISDQDWDKMLSTNLRGPFACIQEVLPGMIERNYGRIVNIVSIGGQWGGINQIHYASAKAGLIGLTRSIAKTFARNGITCNAVSPGLVATDMSAGELSTPAGQAKAQQIPLGRLGTAQEVAAAVAYLVGPGGEYVTGQTINVNGGMYFG